MKSLTCLAHAREPQESVADRLSLVREIGELGIEQRNPTTEGEAWKRVHRDASSESDIGPPLERRRKAIYQACCCHSAVVHGEMECTTERADEISMEESKKNQKFEILVFRKKEAESVEEVATSVNFHVVKK